MRPRPELEYCFEIQIRTLESNERKLAAQHQSLKAQRGDEIAQIKCAFISLAAGVVGNSRLNTTNFASALF